MAAVWAVITLLFLATALITQAILYVVIAGLSGLVTALAAWSAIGEPEPVPARPPGKPKPAKSGGNADPKGSARKPGTTTPKCTKSGLPIDTCPCPEKHVRTPGGATRYKLPIGSPIPGTHAAKRKAT